MPILTVRHLTSYRYEKPVSFGEHRLMFRPRDSYDQKLIDTRLKITPEPINLRWVHDPFGNCVTLVQFEDCAEELRFDSTICLDHSPSSAPDFQIESSAQVYPFSYATEEVPDLQPTI